MTQAKDSLPGLAILMLDTALSTLDRALEAQSVDDARAAISAAQREISSVLTVAQKAAKAEHD